MDWSDRAARGDRAWRSLLLLAASAPAVDLALSAGALGDYPHDAGPAMSALLHGHLHAFASAQPAMGQLSLLLRLPFAAIAYLGSPTQLEVYRWGAVPCMLSLALLGCWLAGIARSRGSGALGQVAIVAVCLFNPLVFSALGTGHPEELLTASFAAGAIVAAAQRRALLGTILIGLAIASKQWALIALFPMLAVFPGRRLRILAGAAAIVAAFSLPALLIAPSAFLHDQLALADGHTLSATAYSWLFPLTPTITRHLAGGIVFHGPHLPSALVGALHPSMIAIGAAAGAYLAFGARGAISVGRLCAAVSLALLLRCTLDTETVPYYHACLLLVLVAWDGLCGERLPWRGLAGTVACYVIFSRLTPSVIGAHPASAIYGLASLGLCVVLARALRTAPRLRRSVPAAAPLPA